MTFKNAWELCKNKILEAKQNNEVTDHFELLENMLNKRMVVTKNDLQNDQDPCILYIKDDVEDS